ncbi:MAG: alkaline phosphatase D family protein, partial [Bdellovibrio sp.]
MTLLSPLASKIKPVASPLFWALAITAAMSLSACSGARKVDPAQLPDQELGPSDAEVIASLPAMTLDLKQDLTLFTFGSCSDQKRPQPLWSTILQTKPQLHLNLGDNVYASKPEERPLLKIYAMQAKLPEYIAFRSVVPMLSTWDDHDYGQNDGGAENPVKNDALKDFRAFYPVDSSLIPEGQKGVYHSVIAGKLGHKIQFILLDTRYNRSPLEKNLKPKHPLDIFQATADKSKTILGEEQWAWLSKELRKPAELRVLVSSIQLVGEDHGFEKWMNFPHERARLFELLKKRRIKNLVVLSGDRHQGEISRMKT